MFTNLKYRQVFSIRSLKLISLSNVIVLLFSLSIQAQVSDPEVFAGKDTVVCTGSVLALGDLNASISGSATDGYWHSLGDGLFDSPEGNLARFSGGYSYSPGENDILAGEYTLKLISDDPDWNGPITPGYDYVTIRFAQTPVLNCNAHLNLPLDINCEYEINLELVFPDADLSDEFFSLELYDQNDTLIPGNIIDGRFHGRTIKARVIFSCNQNSCWTYLTVFDIAPPSLNCIDQMITCFEDSSPDALGFPFTSGEILDTISPTEFTVQGLDDCSLVQLQHVDIEASLECTVDYMSLITRTWTAMDEAGNISTCDQGIRILNPGLDAIIPPPNYDDIEKVALDCEGDWPALDNTYPSPDTTGYPMIDGCENFYSLYEDIEFPLCGNGYKILRTWTVIDWCTSKTKDFRQFIYIKDKIAPDWECKTDTIIIETGIYDCIGKDYRLELFNAVSDCSDWHIEARINKSGKFLTGKIDIDQENKILVLNNLDTGQFELSIDLEDVCGNKTTCIRQIVVRDLSPPIAICEKETHISLGANGYARLTANSLDDGSVDNCQVDRMVVRKETNDPCVEKGNSEFDDYIDFCCLESGQKIEVEFRVFDAANNFNSCFVNVTVQDKLAPEITCPSDVSVDCLLIFDPNNLSEYFGKIALDPSKIDSIYIFDSINDGNTGIDGLAIGSCGISIYEEIENELMCSSGTITRSFYAENDFDSMDSCTQLIRIIDTHPFIGDSIQWPENRIHYGCISDPEIENINDEPLYVEDHCGLVSTTFKDQVLLVEGTYCLKYLRHWTVIDWCQYADGSDKGIWGYDQQILRYDTLSPVFDISIMKDTVACIYLENCLGNIKLEGKATDDCTANEELKWHWMIDFLNEEGSEFVGEGSIIEEMLAAGLYRIYWEVEDGCGNISYLNYQLEITDCKAPVTYCISDLTTVVNTVDGGFDIKAESFDLGSFDNCTSAEDLAFSFEKDLIVSDTTFYCSDIENGIAQIFDLDIWVSDTHSNQNYCTVKLRIQDNLDQCENAETGSLISGLVVSSTGSPIEGAKLELNAIDVNWGKNMETNSAGRYEFSAVPKFIDFSVEGGISSDIAAGISVIDLVLMQRHILGLSEFEDPFQMVAADVNNSGNVSVIDLVLLQKAILNHIIDFPSGESWSVFDKISTERFPDNSQYWIKKSIIEQFETPQLLDFIAVKKGDVNFSYQATNLIALETRAAESQVIYIEKEMAHGDSISYSLMLREASQFEGLQFHIKFPTKNLKAEQIVLLSDQLNQSNLSINKFGDSDVKFCWIPNHPISSDILKLFKITVPAVSRSDAVVPEIIEFSGFESIMVTKGQNFSLRTELVDVTELKTENYHLEILGTNPFSEFVDLRFYSFNQLLPLHVALYSPDGKMIFSHKEEGGETEVNFHLGTENFQFSGVYIFSIEMNGVRYFKKLIKI